LKWRPDHQRDQDAAKRVIHYAVHLRSRGWLRGRASRPTCRDLNLVSVTPESQERMRLSIPSRTSVLRYSELIDR
jgi:hypothetical protein